MQFAVEYLGFAPNYADYRETLELQQRYHQDIVADRRPPTLLLLEHSPVYTAGRRTEAAERPKTGEEVIDIDRGGKITWHGPGQLVAYPLYRLRNSVAVKEYVRQLEQAMIDVCAHYGVKTERREHRAGIWLPATDNAPERKIGAIGISIHKGVSMHGLALNCSNSLAGFDAIIPCGIRDAGVTTLTHETGEHITPEDISGQIRIALEGLTA